MNELSTPQPPPRGMFGLLTDRSFGFFFAARLMTATGVWLHTIVAAIAAFEATGSALIVGLVSFAQFAPQLILGPLSGSLADHGNGKRQMIVGRALSVLGSGTLAWWYLASLGGSPLADTIALAITSMMVGVGLTLGGPSMQAAPMMLVTREELPTAMALNTAPLTLGRVAGPALGALASAGLGHGWAFLAAAAGNLLFIILIIWVVFPPRTREPSKEYQPFRQAISYILTDRPMLLILIGITALGFGSEPTVTLAPPLAASLGGGEMTVGALTTSMGIGAAVGVLISSGFAGYIRHDRNPSIGMAILAISLAICSIPAPQAVSMGAFALAGLGFILAVSSLSTLLQLRLPEHLRGRVMALWIMGFVGSRPLGAMFVGALSDTLNLYVTFGILGGLVLLCAYFCRPSQLRGDR